MAPTWVMPIASLALSGYDGPEAGNGLSYDKDGDFLLYRRITAEDKESWPVLEGIDAVWISLRSDEQ